MIDIDWYKASACEWMTQTALEENAWLISYGFGYTNGNEVFAILQIQIRENES
jgi:hypothetical protein